MTFHLPIANSKILLSTKDKTPSSVLHQKPFLRKFLRVLLQISHSYYRGEQMSKSKSIFFLSIYYIDLLYSLFLFFCIAPYEKRHVRLRMGVGRQVREVGGGIQKCESWVQRNMVKSSSWVTWVAWLHKILSYSWNGMYSYAYMIPHKLPHLP